MRFVSDGGEESKQAAGRMRACPVTASFCGVEFHYPENTLRRHGCHQTAAFYTKLTEFTYFGK